MDSPPAALELFCGQAWAASEFDVPSLTAQQNFKRRICRAAFASLDETLHHFSSLAGVCERIMIIKDIQRWSIQHRIECE